MEDIHSSKQNVVEAEDTRSRELDGERCSRTRTGWVSPQPVKKGCGEWVSRRIMVTFREIGNKNEEQTWVEKNKFSLAQFLFDMSTDHADTRKLEIT